MAHRAMEICSPVLRSISISRLEARGLISRAFSMRSSVVSPWAERTASCVRPHLLSAEHPLAVASGVFNAVMVRGNAVGDVMFYGRGGPSTSAVGSCSA